MRKILPFILVAFVIVAIIIVCFLPDNSGSGTPGGDEPSPTPPAVTPDASEYAERDVTGRNVAYVTIKIKHDNESGGKTTGTVKLLLDATSAPRTVANFLTLAKSGFYDGTDFFSAQQFSATSSLILGGDPTVNGGDPWDETVVGEFTYNGYENDLQHKLGVISMYHSNYSLDDADSCFFISSGDIADLDGYYAPFGYVISGYAVIDKIISSGIYYTDSSSGLILKSRRATITSITIDQDIDYSLISDIYLAPPTSEDLSTVLGEDAAPKKLSLGYAPDSVIRSYKTDDGYAFHVSKKTEDAFSNLLISASADGSIKKVITLPLSAEIDADELASLEGISLENIGEAELSDELKGFIKDVLRTVKASEADDSASKYIYTRDTEGHETYTIEMKVQGYDTPVVILLDKTTAPITVENFLSLVEKGFYDGLDFHRIIKGFMIQGGDDSHLEADKQAASITGEFKSNGYDNDIKHIRGTISMARASEPNSASSGFFICDADAPHLDGGYAAFGYVLSGMETVDAIADYATGKTDSNGNLNEGVEQPVIEYIKIIESAN